MRGILSNAIYPFRIKVIKIVGKPVLIWNMGKVASTSIAQSLWSTHGRHNVLTTHFMNDPVRPRSQIIHDELIDSGPDKLPIITLTREPIGRNISSFFQNFSSNTGASIGKSDFTVEQLIDIFLNKFDKHDVTLSWFDDNLKRYLGFDVYAQKFDQNIGYAIHEHGKFRVLVMRSEEENTIKEQAVKKFLNISDFKLKDSNVGSTKPYSLLYSEFKEKLDLPDTYVEKMMGSKYTQHFYSPSQISAIRHRWLRS